MIDAPELAVRFASTEDLGGLHACRRALENDSVRWHGIPVGDSADARSASFHDTHGWLHDPGKVVIVARHGEAVIGYLLLQSLLYVSARNGIGLAGLWVMPEYRGTIACFRMVRHARRLILGSKFERAQAVVMIGNEGMARMIESHGFRPIAVVYDRGVNHGADRRPKDREQVHEAGGRDSPGRPE